MMKHKHLLHSLVLLGVLLLCLSPLSTWAAGPLDVSREASLTLEYSQDGRGFAGLDVAIYRVASVDAACNYTLCGDFADVPVSLTGIRSQYQWRQITSTLVNYAVADAIAPTVTGATDENGIVVFSGLQTGLYLIRSVTVTEGYDTYIFEDFMSVLPRPDEQDVYQYDVVARPKFTKHTQQPEEIERKVVKLWKDEGAVDKRPASVEVDIFKNGELHSAQTLSAENNWSYSWKAPDDGSQWHAAEREVSEHYTVTVTAEGNTIVITNTYEGEEPPVPDTGDSMVLWPYILVMAICGMLLLVLGLGRKGKTK